MKLVVESWNKKFDGLIPEMRRTALKLGRFFRLRKAQIEIYLVGNNFMNKNVLSFPDPENFPRPDLKKGVKSLGEIYLNPDYIRRESLKIKNFPPKADPPSEERFKINPRLVYMLIHGFLHLLGYDHKKKGDTIVMERKEAEIFSKL